MMASTRISDGVGIHTAVVGGPTTVLRSVTLDSLRVGDSGRWRPGRDSRSPKTH